MRQSNTPFIVLVVIGVVITVIGGGLGMWAYSRYSSIVGQLHTFTPPFTQYEIITMVVGGVGLGLIVIGLILLSVSLIKARVL